MFGRAFLLLSCTFIYNILLSWITFIILFIVCNGNTSIQRTKFSWDLAFCKGFLTLELDELDSEAVSCSMFLCSVRYFDPWEIIFYECTASIIGKWMSYLFLLNLARNTLKFFSLSQSHTTNMRRNLKEEWYHCRVCFAVVIVAMATACCVLLIPLHVWVVFSVRLNNFPEWQQDNLVLEVIQVCH
jgi:hypothetical protein